MNNPFNFKGNYLHLKYVRGGIITAQIPIKLDRMKDLQIKHNTERNL